MRCVVITVARKFWGEVKNLQGVVIPSVHPCSWATDILQPEVCSASLAALIICGGVGVMDRKEWPTTWQESLGA